MQICFKNNKDLKTFKKLNGDKLNLDSFNFNKSVKKLTETNLMKMRLHDKYRILYLIKLNIIYVFYIGNRDHIYSRIKKGYKYNEKNYKKWLIWGN